MIEKLRVRLNSIISWVNSHIIDYPTIKNLILICFIALFLMILVSPIASFNWLLLWTFYYIYKGLYKEIFIIWGFFFFSWYFIFTGLLVGFEGKILVGEEYTSLLFSYILMKYSKYSMIKNFCLCTIIILDALSYHCGFIVYIPSLLKEVLVVIKFIFGGGSTSAKCAPEQKPKGSSEWPSPGASPSGISRESFFSSAASPVSSPKPATTAKYTDYLDQCKDLRRSLHKNRKWFQYWSIKSGKFKGEEVSVYEVRVPIIDYVLREGCHKGKDPKV